MPSPFPGMDPYLESHWGDVHASLIIYAREQLQSRLPSDLRARVEERVFLEAEDGSGRTVVPDVRIYERPGEFAFSTEGGVATVAIAEPLVIPVGEAVTETYIEIREAGQGGRVVTVIEFISKSNKRPGEGRNRYLKKQEELHAAGVNSVEIDLLRDGDYVLGVPEQLVPREYQTPYRVCVWRAVRPLQYEIYRANVRERLPGIRIPLREQDDDVALDLQSLVDRAYLTGAYDDLDYKREVEPPLGAEDVAWADRLLREKKLRD